MKKYFIWLPFLLVGAVLVLSNNAHASSPTYYKGDISQKITSITCGETYSFSVDGHSGSTIWLEQTKGTGETAYNGPIDIPTSPYTSVCHHDEGIYNTRVWEYTNGTKGTYLGSTALTINPAINRHFSFTPDGGTLVAGKDSWTFTLANGVVGDKLTATANLVTDNGTSAKTEGPFQICTITSGSSCKVSRVPTNDDVGTWYEDISINGAYQGKITVTVVASPAKNIPPAPPDDTNTSSLPGYTFTPNHGKLVAGTDSWSMTLNNGNDGDELYIDAWKNGKHVDRMTVCTISNYVVVFPSHSCSNTFLTHPEDVGHWEFKVGDILYGMRAYNAVEGVVLGQRGAVTFEVVAPTAIVKPSANQGTQNYSSDIVKVTLGTGKYATFTYWLTKDENDRKFSHKIPKLNLIPKTQRSSVKKVDPSFLSDYEESDLIRISDDKSVYQLEGNEKHLIPDQTTFDDYGFNSDAVFEIPAQEFKFYKTGDPIPSTIDNGDNSDNGSNIFRSFVKIFKGKNHSMPTPSGTPLKKVKVKKY